MPRRESANPQQGPTSPVRVSEALCKRINRECKRGERRICSARLVGPALEQWVAELFAQVPERVGRLQLAGDQPENVAPRRPGRPAGTIRLPWWQVRRLGIVAEVTGRGVGELVEARVWEWLGERPPEEVERPEEPAALGANCGVGTWD